MKITTGLLVSVWALLCELILVLLPRNNYENGAVSGLIIGLTIGWIIILALLQARSQPKKPEQPSETKPAS